VQLAAAAKLCALLLPQFQLNAQSVVGLCDLLDTSSPGRTFDAGPAWKHILHERVFESLTDAPLAKAAEMVGDAPNVPDDVLPASDLDKVTAAKPAMDDVIGRLSRDPQRMVKRRLEDVEFIVINHTAAPPITPLQTIATAFHRRLPGILYQYFISSNGAVYQTQPLTEVVDGRLPYIARAINIGFAGKFDDDIPTPAQIRSGRDLIAWLLEEIPQLTLASIRGVNEFISHSSPGEQWLQGRRWKDILITAVRTGNLVYTAGTGPGLPDGGLLHVGKLGAEISIEQGYDCARLTMLNLLSNLKGEIGDLDKVKRVVKLLCMVNAAPEFTQTPQVANGASDLLVGLFGEKGRHARSAVGMSTLPGNMPIEIEMIVEVED